MTARLTNASIAASCTQRINALKAHLSAKTVIGIAGVSYKPADLIAVYQEVLDTQAALIKSRAQADSDLASRNAAELQRETVEGPLRSWVLNHLGADSNATKEFGFAPPKKPKRTAEEKADAVKLALATREARGTKGKKQKLSIKGSLETPTAPAAPAPTLATPAVAIHLTPAVATPVATPAASAVTGTAAPPATTSS